MLLVYLLRIGTVVVVVVVVVCKKKEVRAEYRIESAYGCLWWEDGILGWFVVSLLRLIPGTRCRVIRANDSSSCTDCERQERSTMT